jgi:hypothetical protein
MCHVELKSMHTISSQLFHNRPQYILLTSSQKGTTHKIISKDTLKNVTDLVRADQPPRPCNVASLVLSS